MLKTYFKYSEKRISSSQALVKLNEHIPFSLLLYLSILCLYLHRLTSIFETFTHTFKWVQRCTHWKGLLIIIILQLYSSCYVHIHINKIMYATMWIEYMYIHLYLHKWIIHILSLLFNFSSTRHTYYPSSNQLLWLHYMHTTIRMFECIYFYILALWVYL